MVWDFSIMYNAAYYSPFADRKGILGRNMFSKTETENTREGFQEHTWWAVQATERKGRTRREHCRILACGSPSTFYFQKCVVRELGHPKIVNFPKVTARYKESRLAHLMEQRTPSSDMTVRIQHSPKESWLSLKTLFSTDRFDSKP